jgi:flagellar motor component MotA
MRRHELDPVSLFFGLVFLFVSGGYLVSHTTDVQLHWLLVVPAALIAVGAAIFASVVRRMQRADQADRPEL